MGLLDDLMAIGDILTDTAKTMQKELTDTADVVKAESEKAAAIINDAGKRYEERYGTR